jgi:hypothetical protein
MKQTFNQLVKGFNKDSLSKDLTNEQIIIVIKYITNSTLIDDTDKRNLIQQFILNCLTLTQIKDRI